MIKKNKLCIVFDYVHFYGDKLNNSEQVIEEKDVVCPIKKIIKINQIIFLIRNSDFIIFNA